MSRNIVPRIDKGANLGTPEKNWDKLHVDAVVLRGNDLQALLNGKTNLNTLMAKGDIYVATGPGAVTRLAKGTDGYVLKANSGTTEGLMWGPVGARQELTNNITVTVGDNGDFPTINAALENIVALYYPKYKQGAFYRVTIQLLSGFVMQENVVVESLDLSWITISGIDEETMVVGSAIPTYGWIAGTGFSIFLAKNGGFLPIINQLFHVDGSGSSTMVGIYAYAQSRAIVNPGCGIKNASLTGIRAENNSIIYAPGAIATPTRSNGGCGIYAGNNSIIYAPNVSIATVPGAISYGIYAIKGSIINANGATVTNIGQYGIYATSGSIINAGGATVTNIGQYGIYANSGSIIHAGSATVTDTGQYGIYVTNGSIINASGATADSISPTPNTITSGGIIFQ